MKSVGIILAIVCALIVVLFIFHMIRLIRIAKKTGNADEIRAARKNNLEEISMREANDRKRLDEILGYEDEKAAYLSQLIEEHATAFTLDWSYRKAEKDLGLDGVHDGTGVNWIVVKEGASLASAAAQYIVIRQYIAENGSSYRARDAVMWSHEITHLRVLSEKYVEALGPMKDDVFKKCKEYKIRIVMEKEDNRYYDFIDQCEYEVLISSTWPGSADDAATYGMLELIEI